MIRGQDFTHRYFLFLLPLLRVISTTATMMMMSRTKDTMPMLIQMMRFFESVSSPSAFSVTVNGKGNER